MVVFLCVFNISGEENIDNILAEVDTNSDGRIDIDGKKILVYDVNFSFTVRKCTF